ncbi:MAG: GtrA family protein [Spirochaetaceae bacterium]|jgi:putative flippase GtrA|nr:GtrA family protein [Spirochaetaceae bacterium]
MQRKDSSAIELTTAQNVVQILKFIAFSFSAGIIQAVSFTLLNEFTDFPYWPCYLIALILSVLFNFTVNRRFTFKSANNVPIAMMKVAAFYLVFTPLSTWFGNLAAVAGINEYIILGVTMGCNLITEFLYQRFFVFRDSINTRRE